MTRQSISFREMPFRQSTFFCEMLFRKRMDPRVKPGGDACQCAKSKNRSRQLLVNVISRRLVPPLHRTDTGENNRPLIALRLRRAGTASLAGACSAAGARLIEGECGGD